MPEIIDLSQEIYAGMPVYKGLPRVEMEVFKSHEEWEGNHNATEVTPGVHRLSMGEHTGSHVDAINHMAKKFKGRSIDTMPLSMFYTEGICLDLSHKELKELIEVSDLQEALHRDQLKIKQNDTVLIYTDHFRRYYNTNDWGNGPGLTVEATQWLGRHKIAAFGVETMSPGIPGKTNKEVHLICGEMNFTHYENLINLYKLVHRGRFRFIGLPLKIRGGTGSPVRAVAIFE